MTALPTEERTLVLERTLKAPRERFWRCRTQGDLLMQWYCPMPWRVIRSFSPHAACNA